MIIKQTLTFRLTLLFVFRFPTFFVLDADLVFFLVVFLLRVEVLRLVFLVVFLRGFATALDLEGPGSAAATLESSSSDGCGKKIILRKI